jgi:hypothetical protein
MNYVHHGPAVIAVFTCLGSQAAPQVTVPRNLYSNVVYIAEAGELAGFELDSRFDGSAVSGELRNYEGGCGIPTDVSGTRDGKNIRLRGLHREFGSIEIAGTLEP